MTVAGNPAGVTVNQSQSWFAESVTLPFLHAQVFGGVTVRPLTRKWGFGHIVSKMNRKAIIRKRASIPLEGYPDVVSAISAIRTKWKGSSQASQSGWSMPPIFDGGTRQLTLLANAPNSEDHKTTFVRSSPRRRGKNQTKPRKRETHSCNNSPIPLTEAGDPAIVSGM